MHFRRRNLAWLSMIGTLVAIVLLSGAASPGVTAALAGLFMLALVASVIDMRPAEIREIMPRSPLARVRMSPQAREARERARRRGSMLNRHLTLLDIGLISSRSSREGMVMRRSRNISLDDDGVRPYITLHVGVVEADRKARVRFEILDHHGTQQYIHETEIYLRDGEMNILADHHLPLAGSDRIGEAGDWDLRVYLDGALSGVLGFTMSPSLRERSRQAAASAGGLVDEMEDAPLSLEALLRSEGSRQRH